MGIFTIIAAIIAVATSAASYMQAKKAEKLAAKQAEEMAAVQISGFNNNRSLYTVYGQALVGSTIVWKKVSGNRAPLSQSGFVTKSRATGSDLTSTQSKSTKRYLYRAVTLCNGPVQEISTILVDGENFKSARFGQGNNFHFGAAISLGPTAGLNYSRLRSYSQADFGAWDSTKKGQGVAYAMERLYLDKKNPAYQGEPATQYLVKGRLIYDPRLDTTVTGGSGSHRADDATTWAWSDNPALALLDYLTNAEYGRGLPYSSIDLAAIISAANSCDVLVPIPARTVNDTGSTMSVSDVMSDGAYDIQIVNGEIISTYRANQTSANTQKRYRLNIAIDGAKEVLENIQQILNVFKGNLVYVNGVYTLTIADVANPVLTLDNDDIMGGLSISDGDRSQRMNRATVKFINENKNYKTDQVSWPLIGSSEYNAYLAEDQNEQLHRTFTIDGCTDFYQAEDAAEFLVRDGRAGLTVRGRFGSRALALVPGDVVSLTYDSAAYSGKYFIVNSVALDLATMDVNLALREYDSSVYTWNSGRGNEPLGLNWELEPPNLTPDSLTIGTITVNTVIRSDGTSIMMMTVPFSDVSEDADRVEVSYSIANANNYNTIVVTDLDNESSVTFPVEQDNVTYDIRLRYVVVGIGGTQMPSAYVYTTMLAGVLVSPIGTKIDGVAEGATANVIYRQDEPPAASGLNVDDQWFDTNDGNKHHLWTGSAWVSVQDLAIAIAEADAAAADLVLAGRIAVTETDIADLVTTYGSTTAAAASAAAALASQTAAAQDAVITAAGVQSTAADVVSSAADAAATAADVISTAASAGSAVSEAAAALASANSAAGDATQTALDAAAASNSSAAALISENNAATSESNAAGSQSSASSSSTLAASAQTAAEAALAVAKVEIAAIGPSRVTPIVENWATQSHNTNLQSGDDRFVGTVALAESHFTTSDSVFGDAYNYNSATTNLTFGPRKAYPYGADKVYMVRVIYRVAVESTLPYGSYGTNTYIGATTRGGDGLTLIENSQPGQQVANAADGELEFVMVFHGGDYATGSLDSLNIVDSNKTFQDNGVISFKLLTSQGAGANGSDAPAEHIGFHLRQNASDASNGTLAVKSYEVFDITDIVLAELKAGEAAVSAAAALVSEGAASASDTAAGQSASTASTQAGVATTQAGLASTSASQASTSESNAQGHESAASTSETNAASSASDASGSEANALTYRDAAATSATNAAGSESAAATSEGISVGIQDRMNLVDGGVVNAGFEADQASTSIDTWPTGWDCEGQRYDAPRDIGVVDNVVNSTGDFASTKSFGTHVDNAGTTGHWLRLSKYFVAEATQKFNVDMAVRLAGTTASSYNQDPEWIDEDDVFIIYNWYDEDGALLSQAAVSSATSEYSQANSSWISGTSKAPQQTWFDYVSDEGTAPTNAAFVRIDLILIDDQPGNIGTDVLVNYATWAVGGNFRGYIDDVQFLSSNGSIVETNKANLEGAVSAAASQTSASNASASESAAGTSASTASTQAGVATTKAGEASTSAGAAATSASNAQGSANTATSQAALATTAKNDAETAETNAQASESAAATSESNAQGHSSTASSQATLAATAKSDTDDLKDAVLVETAANGEIQFVNPTSWQHVQQSHNLYSGDNRFAGDGNATPSFFIDNDAEFGSAYVPTLGLNESVSPRRVQPYSSDKVYLVRLIARVVNDGATIANGVRVTLGINGWKADGTRITSSPDVNNYQPVYITKTVADGTFELSVFFGGSDYTDAELEAFDLVTENAPAGQSGGRAWAIIPPSTGTNHEPDLAYVNFQVRYNSSTLTDGQIALKTLEVIDVTESIKAEIKADAAAISASAALVSEGAASASQTAAGNSATTSTQQAGIASTKAGDASGFASDASGFATTAQQSASTAAGSASTASTQAGLAATAKNDAESARDSMVLDNIVVDSRLANATLIGGWDTSNYERSTTQKYFGGHSLKSKSVIFSDTYPIFYRTDIPIISGEKFTWGAWVYKNFATDITLQFQNFGGWAAATVTATSAWQFVTGQGTAASDVAANLDMDIRSHTGGSTREIYIDGLIIVRGHHDLTVVETSDRAATAEVLSEVSAAASLVSSGAASASATTAGDEAAISSQQAGIATTKAGEALTYRNQAAQSVSDASGFSASASQSSGLAVTAKDAAEAARDGIVYQNYAFDGTFPGGVKPQWTTSGSEYTTSTTYKKIGTHSLKILASNTSSTDIFKSYDLDSFPDIAIGDKFTWGMWVYIDGSGTTGEIFGFAGNGGWGTTATAVRNSWVFLTTTGTSGDWAPVNGLRLELRSAPIGSSTDNAIYVDGVIVVRGEVDLTSVEVDDSSVRSAHKSSVSASAALASAQSASASESDAGDFASTASTQAGIATTKAGEASSFASTASDSADDAEGFKNTASQESGVASGHSSTAQGFASASNVSAGAAATSATNAAASATASAVDNRLLEARVNSPLNGHYANSEWYLYNISTAYVVSYFTGTDIRIQNMATGTWYDVKKNATRITNYRVDTLSGQSGIGPWRVSASGPIVCKHANGHMGVPANFGGTLLGNIANRYQPVDIYLFSPDTEASVDVFVSESYTGFSNTSTPNHTITVPAGGFYHWQQDVDWGSTQTSGNTTILFRSDARVSGIWVPDGGDFMLMAPLTNGEAVGGVETENGSGYPYYNDGATNTTVTTESDGSARYYVNNDPKFYFMQAATADGAGGDAEFAIPREGLSDYYIWPEPNISNFRMVAVEPGTVKVMRANGTVLFTKEFGANTTTTSPTFLSEGSNTGATNIDVGGGPYRFVGTVPFHLVCQEDGDDDETVMLGARQSKLAESGAIKAAAVSLNTVSSAVDGQATTIGVQASSINGLQAQYSVKIDNNGHVSGFGLSSVAVDGTPASAFVVRADKFAIVDPASTANNLTNTPSAASIPFLVTGGAVYIKSAAIEDASITAAKIGSVNADTITAGTIDAANVNISGVTSGIDLKSSASGARMEIKSDSIKVFDSSGQVRIKLGNL